ncbi:zinc-finger domain-containing protein [Paenibacillus agilis]|uniref:Zinc-finger domain-containing protein n=1 Tax=Paenibacillus agilis TaxID=3020863 RepID=A0A559IEA1_9BACL|nr:zinc-finger domain-containing protein [Paenibacillus agilis]TVX85989.1 zinc-finger domain-containing protein [Paenibacillus agilis]
MKAEVRRERVKLLMEIDRIQQPCDGCRTRAHFNNLKDATGLSHACKACPVGKKLSQYGNKLLKLT